MPQAKIMKKVLHKLACPLTGEELTATPQGLSNRSNTRHFSFDERGIPLFAEQPISTAAQTQQAHFDKVASAYAKNLSYPHTQEYNSYLDRELQDAILDLQMGDSIEICCGLGEAVRLFKGQMETMVGVDISQEMLHRCQDELLDPNMFLLQGDATQLPLMENSFDTVFMLGGIHHVSDREKLFSEVFRILKPGGSFVFREPVSDFYLWKIIRWLVYRMSPYLDAETERPLTWDETVPVLQRNGLALKHWSTHGFLGFMVFMNSDILIFNRLFRFIPGIRKITRMSSQFDKWLLDKPMFNKFGLQVIGLAVKPTNQ